MIDPYGCALRLDPEGINMAIDEAKLNEFLGKAVGDLGAAMSATLMLIGDRLGLYKELAKDALTPAQQAGEARLREVVVTGAGFGRFRRATETPFNLVLEARP